jgi:hypothetical protein
MGDWVAAGKEATVLMVPIEIITSKILRLPP